MKKGSVLFLTILCLMQICLGAPRVPNHVFTMNELEEAKVEAKEKNQPLIFVYTDLGST